MSGGKIDLIVAGLGPAGLDLLPAATLRAITEAPCLILRTERHPAAQELRAEGTVFRSLDSFYAETAAFEALYPKLAETVFQAVTAPGAAHPVVYAVPGHPLLGEESVRQLLMQARDAGLSVRVLAAPGFVDVVAPALAAAGELPDLTQWQVADGAALSRVWWDTERPTLIFQVDDGPTASRVKLALLEEYPDDFPVCVVRSAGDPERESVVRVPLHQLDRAAAGKYDHLSTVYVPALAPEDRKPHFQDFVDVVAQLRSPEGCPWDQEQTHASLKRYLLEEAYEVLEAIDADDPDKLSDELGDLMLQVVLHAQIGTEAGLFTVRDVIGHITAKMIRRHPHVFAGLAVEGVDEVNRNWEAIKRREKGEAESVLDGVPRELPALMKALDVSKRVVKVGFEWPTLDAVLEKLDEEVAELKAELPERDPERLRGEIGDLLFTVVNIARWLKIDPEDALRQMVERFGRRFREVERLAAEAGTPLSSLDITQLDRLWDQAKASLG